MDIGIITLFPEAFAALNCGVTGRAIKQNLITLHHWNPRDFATDKYRTTDDRPYGGGPGMLMKVQPLQEAIKQARKIIPNNPKVILASPKGRKFDQTLATNLAARQKPLIFVAGRYEGIDERLIASEIDASWSIGDYVLTGGELPIMVIIDTITRLLPGTLNDDLSAKCDSFVTGLLDYPHYTRPETINGLTVPAVLLSGNHAAIKKWRIKQSLGKTWLHRPDLLAKIQLNELQEQLLTEFIQEHRGK